MRTGAAHFRHGERDGGSGGGHRDLRRVEIRVMRFVEVSMFHYWSVARGSKSLPFSCAVSVSELRMEMMPVLYDFFLRALWLSKAVSSFVSLLSLEKGPRTPGLEEGKRA